MEELISMGFSKDVAARALSGNGGDVHRAADWILNRCSDDSSNTQINPNKSNSFPKTTQQPTLDRFFGFESKQANKVARSGNNEGRVTKRHKAFEGRKDVRTSGGGPLAERMRPKIVEDVVGQEQLLSSNTLLKSAIECGRLPSVILWGPPGCGKTTLAKAIVNSTKPKHTYRFVTLSAVTCGVKDVRDAVADAKSFNNAWTVLFIDEVHRFNKAQQDSLLPVIEDGSVVFMGATTENPSSHLITPLLSRCRLLALNPLRPEHIATLLTRAVSDLDKGLLCSISSGGFAGVQANDEALVFLSGNADGDARVALNALEMAATTAAARLHGNRDVVITLSDVKEALQCKHIGFDRAGVEPYYQISALLKSMAGNDPDAAIYWLVKMLEGGEQPLYIARRLIRFASEDVVLADPSAMAQAVNCYQACHFVGMPECDVMLAQCVSYLSMAPKSITVHKAFEAAQKAVKESVGQNERVPLHLRNASTKLMTDVGYGKGYIYPPENPDIAQTQTYLPPSLQETYIQR